ncbi:MAG: hypothetical protein EA423_08415 [Phycisphaerales bacterium]|nr:MAG: hypothetical protein EA423_08415 [Phycisphaerales bacterium]
MTSLPAGASGPTYIGEAAPELSLLRRYSPLRLLFGPSFAKEMRVTGRKASTYSYRFGYTLLLLLVIGLAFWGASTSFSGGGAASAMQQYQAIAPVTAASIVWIQFVVLALLAPSLTAGAVADEKLARTLPSLMTTPLPASEIILGKFSARMVLLLILAAIPTPILLSVRVFGGLSGSYIAYSLAVSLSVFVLGLACGTLMSVRSHRSSAASAGGLGLMVTIIMLPMIALVVLDRADALSVETSESLMLVFSPAAMVTITDNAFFEDAMPRILPAITYNLIFSVVVLALAVISCRRVLNRYAAFDAPAPVKQKKGRRKERARPEPERKSADRNPTPGAADDAPADPASGDASARVEKKPRGLRFASTNREVWDDPLLWRELRQPAFTGRVKLGVTVGAALLFWLWLALGGGQESVVLIHGLAAFVGLMIFGVQVASRASGAIAQEREARTLDTLLTVPVSPLRIVLAKAVGSFRQLWFVPVFLIVHFGFIGVYTETAHPVFVLHLAMVYAGAAIFLVGLGTVMGLIFKKALAASTLTQGAGLLLWLVLPVGYQLLLSLIYIVSTPPVYTRHIMDAMLAVNPFIMLGKAFEPGVVDLSRALPGSHQLSYGPIFGYHDLGPFVYTLVIAAALLLSVLFAAASIWLASKRFNRFVGRPS